MATPDIHLADTRADRMETTVMPKVRHWLAIPALLFAAAIALGLIAAHTGLIRPHELSAELSLQRNTQTGWLNTTMLDVAQVASPLGGLVILVLLVGFLLWRRLPAEAVSTFLVIAVGWNSSQVIKVVVARNRPALTQWSLAPETGSNSYPSGHTAFAVSLAVAVYFLVRQTRWATAAIVLGSLWVLVIGFSRIYIGAHYPTDVLGSILVSSAAIVLLTGIWHRWIVGELYRVPLLDRFGTLPSGVSQEA